jgi:murein peptide amidase A
VTAPERTGWVRGLAAGLLAAAVGVPVLGLPLLAGSAVPVTTAAATASQPVRSPTAVTRAWRAAAASRLVIGTSVQGRPIVAVRRGAATAASVLLLVGQMHGSEPGGMAVAARLAQLRPPPGLQVWIISTINPDGSLARRRTNAHGVDLNRNFRYRWSRTATSRIYNPGPRPWSEPEARALAAFLDHLRPDLVVSLHQAFNSVDTSPGKTRTWAVRLARALHLRARVVPCGVGPCHGTMTSWYDAGYVGSAITVELPARVPPSWATADARAILAVASLLVPRPPVPPSTPSPSPSPSSSPSSSPSTSTTPSGSTSPSP